MDGTPMLRAVAQTLSAAALSALCAFGGTPPGPVVYNDARGDGGATLDRVIKETYGARYTIIDTGSGSGYAGPTATAGALPTTAASQSGEPLSGYVLAAYIVSAAGLVSDPVILRSTDERLGAAAAEAMSHWRFTPGTLNGAPVASTAAQEFTFGPTVSPYGFAVDHVAIYQSPQVLLRRLPGRDKFGAYVDALGQVAHRFFVGDTAPETISLVVELQPGGHSRVWLVSSRRDADSAQLAPLRALLEGVAPVDVQEGPAAFAIVGAVAGAGAAGDRQAPPPVPREWRQALRAASGVAYGTDEVLEAVWKEAR